MRRIAALAWPLVLHGLVNVVVATNDVALLGAAGPRVVASAVVASSVLTVLVLAVGAFAIATQIEAARALGAGDPAGARAAVDGSLRLVAIVGLPVLLVVSLGAGPLTELLGGQASDAGLAADYLRLTLLGVPAALLAAVLRSYATALSRSRVVLVAGLCAAGSDVGISLALEPVFGWRGVAVGTASGYLVSAGVFVAWRTRRDPDRRPRWRAHRVGTERAIFGLGWPEALFALFSSAAGVVVVVVLADSTSEVLAASRYLAVLTTVSHVALLAVGQALLTPLSASRGAQRDDDFRRTLRCGAVVIAALALPLFALGAALSRTTVDWLGGPDVAATVGGLGWLNSAQVVWQAACALLVAICRSVRDTRAPLVASLIAEYVVFLPLGWLLCRHLGLDVLGVLLAHHAFWATFVAVAAWRARAAWRQRTPVTQLTVP